MPPTQVVTELPPLNEMVRHCNYLNIPPVIGSGAGGTTIAVIELANEINAWFAHRRSTDNHQAAVTIQAGRLALIIGDNCVWDSECNSEDDLVLTNLLRHYREECLQMTLPFQKGVDNPNDGEI
jgi:hypothetical protein